ATASSSGRMMQTIIMRMKTAVPRYGPICSMNQLLTMGSGLLLGADEGLGAFRHGRRGAADRVGHVIVGDRRFEGPRVGAARFSKSFPRSRLDRVQALEALVRRVEFGAELIQRVIAERLAELLGERAQDGPVFLCLSRREDREHGKLRP